MLSIIAWALYKYLDGWTISVNFYQQKITICIFFSQNACRRDQRKINWSESPRSLRFDWDPYCRSNRSPYTSQARHIHPNYISVWQVKLMIWWLCPKRLMSQISFCFNVCKAQTVIYTRNGELHHSQGEETFSPGVLLSRIKAHRLFPKALYTHTLHISHCCRKQHFTSLSTQRRHPYCTGKLFPITFFNKASCTTT